MFSVLHTYSEATGKEEPAAAAGLCLRELAGAEVFPTNKEMYYHDILLDFILSPHVNTINNAKTLKKSFYFATDAYAQRLQPEHIKNRNIYDLLPNVHCEQCIFSLHVWILN